MSDEQNIYQGGNQSQLMMNQNILNILKKTSPWVIFLGVLTLVCTCLIWIGALIILLSVSGNLNIILFLSVALVGVLCFFPGYFLFKFGTRIRRAIAANATSEMEIALKSNKSYWKYIGILTIVGIIINVINFLFGLAN